jgi:hypothetical protein
MAWQVLLVRLPLGGATSIEALPVDYVPPAIGEPEQVIERITDAAKRACVAAEQLRARPFADGSRVVVMRTEEFVIEAELGGPEEIDHVLLHVLGSDAALPLVGSLARALEVSAVDCETDKVLDADAIVPDTLRQWQIRIDQLR